MHMMVMVMVMVLVILCQIGNFLKYPKNPVWLVASSSHYSVVFSTDPKVSYIHPTVELEHEALAHFKRLDDV